jgi:hypothetical protein
MRRLILTAAAAAILVLPTAAAAHEVGHPQGGEHPASTPTPGTHPEAGHPGFAFMRICHRAIHNPNLSDGQQAAIADACVQLKSDLHAAASRLADAINSARDEVQPAIEAAIAACGNGQFDSDACRQARTAAEQAKRQAIQDVAAAHRQFLRDAHAAIEAFKNSLQSLRGGAG